MRRIRHYSLETERIILRQWRQEDFAPFASINADAETMRYFPKVLSTAESEEMALKCQALIDEKGWGFWAVELKETGEFIGLIGLRYQEEAMPEAPFMEVGWRIARKCWGKGVAPEAANAAIKFAFDELKADAVYAFTTLSNEPSRKVMTKLGMKDTGLDFDHPQLASDHPLVRHCLYKVSHEQWLATSGRG